jgi:S1-C subfamily serine protease
MASSSSATFRSSPAGSKVVREQRELVADRREALRRRLGGCGGGHLASEGNVPVPVLGIDVPARLILRALDDLHAIAQAARTLPDVEARLAQRIDELESRATEVLDAVSTAEATLDDGIAVGRQLEERAGVILDSTERIVAAAHAVAEGADHVAAVLPSLEASATAATMLAQTAEPLQGMVERLGRIADRLPGGGRRQHE